MHASFDLVGDSVGDSVGDLAGDLAGLRLAYSRFLRPGRILLSGHSHQAWPDDARAAQTAYFDDAAEFVDEKWDRALLPRLDLVRQGILRRLGLPATDAVSFAHNTHELVFRLLSCLPIFGDAKNRPRRILTTTGEFHSLRRQLRRLEEAGVPVTWIDAHPRATLTDRLLNAIDLYGQAGELALLAVSAVLFEDSFVLPGLPELLARTVRYGALPLVDAYHAFNVVPLDLGPAVDHVFLTAGGYKYAAFGEGLCFLRFPGQCELRPVFTGWFADFAGLAAGPGAAVPVGYGPDGQRFAGSTFDGSAVYRAQAALSVWDRFGLDVPRLRRISLAQTRRILERAPSSLEIATPRDPDRRGGFVSLRTPSAATAGGMVQALRRRGVHTDSRGDLLRLGPAPYLTQDEIDTAMDLLHEVTDEVTHQAT